MTAPRASAWWGLALAHGAAWSVAWAAQIDDRGWTGKARTSPLVGAALNALFALTLGLAVSAAGLIALTGWHVALGGAGALAALAGTMNRQRLLHPASSTGGRARSQAERQYGGVFGGASGIRTSDLRIMIRPALCLLLALVAAVRQSKKRGPPAH